MKNLFCNLDLQSAWRTQFLLSPTIKYETENQVLQIGLA